MVGKGRHQCILWDVGAHHIVTAASQERYSALTSTSYRNHTGYHWGACNLKFGRYRRCATSVTFKFEVAGTPVATRVFLGLFRDVSFFLFSFEAFCTDFWGSLFPDPRKPVEDEETLNYHQDHNFPLRSISAHGTTKFEGDLRFSSKDTRKTVTRLPGSFVRIRAGPAERWCGCLQADSLSTTTS